MLPFVLISTEQREQLDLTPCSQDVPTFPSSLSLLSSNYATKRSFLFVNLFRHWYLQVVVRQYYAGEKLPAMHRAGLEFWAVVMWNLKKNACLEWPLQLSDSNLGRSCPVLCHHRSSAHTWSPKERSLQIWSGSSFCKIKACTRRRVWNSVLPWIIVVLTRSAISIRCCQYKSAWNAWICARLNA